VPKDGIAGDKKLDRTPASIHPAEPRVNRPLTPLSPRAERTNAVAVRAARRARAPNGLRPLLATYTPQVYNGAHDPPGSLEPTRAARPGLGGPACSDQGVGMGHRRGGPRARRGAQGVWLPRRTAEGAPSGRAVHPLEPRLPSIDADRAAAAGAIAIQINTGGECHLDAVMFQQALDQLDLTAIDLLLVENVGNLVCPANFPLGTHRSVLVASVPEGDDKPYKYPGTYRGVDALVINKIDLLPYVTFDMEHFRRGVALLNPGLVTFPVSCRTGEGLEAWYTWIEQAEAAFRSASPAGTR
jgi:Ni2+-binding GTPase involved in maturation of urease and hydrogenase